MLSPLFKNQVLQIRSLSAFLFIGLAIVSVGWVSFQGTSWLSNSFNSLANNSMSGTVELWKINDGQSQIQLSENLLLNPALSLIQKQRELARIESSQKQIEEAIAAYQSVDRTSNEEEEYRRFKQEFEKWKNSHQEFMQLYSQNAFISGTLQPKGQAASGAGNKIATTTLEALNQQWLTKNIPAAQEMKASLEELLETNTEFVRAANKATVAKVERVKFWVIGGLVIGLIITIGLGVYFSQMVAKPLSSKLTKVIKKVQDTSLQVTTSVTEIAASSRELEATFTEQVASTNQVGNRAQEIASTSKDLVRTMENVMNMSQATAGSAVNSQQDLQSMKSTMTQLAKATTGISSKLDLIREKANNISTVVTTITKVADQTNLLSLNAAIEAEKAGEYGQGFSVVSREIRRLADQTAVATLEIDGMVKEMQSAVASGVMEMDKFTNEVERGAEDIRRIGAQIAQMIKKVQSLTPHFEIVNQGMEQQSYSAEQISESMMQLGEASTQTADALREINIVLDRLNETAGHLSKEMGHFQVG
jgi:methyl-accepting chemotaxis protein WspA